MHKDAQKQSERHEIPLDTRSNGTQINQDHMNTAFDSKFSRDPIFQRVLRDALAIQDRFQADPVYSRTGQGFLRSAGVGMLKKIKEDAKRKINLCALLSSCSS
ncbi:MAG: hypothetical protein WCS31_04570 [Verrucomicrobiae bacterium]